MRPYGRVCDYPLLDLSTYLTWTILNATSQQQALGKEAATSGALAASQTHQPCITVIKLNIIMNVYIRN